MKNILEKLSKLIDVKSIITLVLVLTLVILAIRQNVEISTEMFASSITLILGFYFAKQNQGGS